MWKPKNSMTQLKDAHKLLSEMKRELGILK
jgi:hypothetical protein